MHIHAHKNMENELPRCNAYILPMTETVVGVGGWGREVGCLVVEGCKYLAAEMHM